MNNSAPHLAYAAIRRHAPHSHPKIGIVLGSGLGGFIKHLKNSMIIPYTELPGFPVMTVAGHQGQLILGELAGVPVVCLQGRAHTYEGGNALDAIKTYVRTLRLLGCETFIATNAAGSLDATIGPGALMMITDHINLQPTNPLVGPNDDEFGPRFYPLDHAYDLNIRTMLAQAAVTEDIMLHQGIYVSVLGPHFETAAEIKAFRLLGADAVGMSTVPEVLVANHCGMHVGVISVITNYATGLTTTSHSHASVIAMAEEGEEKLSRLLIAYCRSIN